MGEKRYLLTDNSTGEIALVDRDTVERLVGIEIGYIDWAIKCDGKVENGIWVVARNAQHTAGANPISFEKSRKAVKVGRY